MKRRKKKRKKKVRKKFLFHLFNNLDLQLYTLECRKCLLTQELAHTNKPATLEFRLDTQHFQVTQWCLP